MAKVRLLLTAECDASHLAHAQTLLDADEREKAARFVFEEHRRAYTLAHGMLRTVLAQALGISARDVRFAFGSHGKPSVEGLAFNMSHTDGCVAVALGTRPLGIDVENGKRRADVLGICERFFSAAEVAALRALPKAEQHERFFRYWTLKEAYIKARGLGLAIPLADFGFQLEGPAIAIEFAEGFDDEPSRWRFFQTTADPYMVALCTSPEDEGADFSFFSFE